MSETFNYMDKLESLPEGFTLPESVTSLAVYVLLLPQAFRARSPFPAGVTYPEGCVQGRGQPGAV